jgi:putative intracellular protease/amidase
VDLASETGTCGFDGVSLTPPFLSGSDHAILNNPKHPFMVKIKSQLKKASDLKKEDYGFFFASAAHSALYDYPTAKGLQAVAAYIWERGGIVGTVCHILQHLQKSRLSVSGVHLIRLPEQNTTASKLISGVRTYAQPALVFVSSVHYRQLFRIFWGQV